MIRATFSPNHNEIGRDRTDWGTEWCFLHSQQKNKAARALHPPTRVLHGLSPVLTQRW